MVFRNVKGGCDCIWSPRTSSRWLGDSTFESAFCLGLVRDSVEMHPIPKVIRSRGIDFASIAVLFVLWFGIAGFAGRLSDGVRWVDDYLIFEMSETLNQAGSSWFELAMLYDREWSHFRFHPLNFAYKTLWVQLFGTDLTVRMYAIVGLGFMSSVLFYGFMRKCGIFPPLAVCFPILMLFGSRSMTYFEHGDAEPISVLLMSCSMIAIPYLVTARNVFNRLAWNIVFILFTLAMGLSKENFVLFIPALIPLLILVAKDLEPGLTWMSCLRKHAITCLILFLLFFSMALLAYLRIDLRETPYAPSLSATMNGFGRVASYFVLKKDVLIAVVATVSLVFGICYLRAIHGQSRTAFGNTLRLLGVLSVIATAALLPQIFVIPPLPSLPGRYLLPGVFATSFSCIWIANEGYRTAKLSRLFLPVIALIVIYALGISYTSYRVGRQIQNSRGINAELLHYVLSKTPAESAILLVASDNEPGHAYTALTMRGFLKSFGNRNSVYLVGIDMEANPFVGNPLFLQSNPMVMPSYADIWHDLPLTIPITTVIIFSPLHDDFLKANEIRFCGTEWSREELDCSGFPSGRLSMYNLLR